jgi:DNA-directed RNA polymerase specialized sigma subunit
VTYHATAKRWALGWELHIDGVGVTQSRSLATAEKMVREYIASMLDVDEGEGDVVITPELSPKLAAEVAEAHEATRRAEEARDEAARKARKVVHNLKDADLSGSDVAEVLGVSTQRVSQLVKDPQVPQ